MTKLTDGRALQPIDLVGHRLRGMFGMSEYETGIAAIIAYLADDRRCLKTQPGSDWPALHGRGWTKLFRIDTIHDLHPSLFAMLCADGWITSCHFPKGTFLLSEAARLRITERMHQL